MVLKFSLYKLWLKLWGTDDKNIKKLGNFSLNEEIAIKKLVVSLLSKDGVVVNISTETKKHYIIHPKLGVNILINGGTENVKISNHDWKYAWKFRNSFINELINLVVKKDEEILTSWETEIFENEIALLNKISEKINTLNTVT